MNYYKINPSINYLEKIEENLETIRSVFLDKSYAEIRRTISDIIFGSPYSFFTVSGMFKEYALRGLSFEECKEKTKLEIK